MEIKPAIEHYCRYQPRCHVEVRNKLYELGCTTPEVESYISEMITSGLLNEEAYARAYARGRFRMKQWGKVKIINQLRFHKVSEYCIKKGLSEIDGEEYYQTLTKLVEKKWQELKKERSQRIRIAKTMRYVLQKGYESSLAQDVINNIIAS